MTIKQKLSLNIGVVSIMVAVLVVVSFIGTNVVRGKLSYLTQRSTPHQLKSIEYQKAVQSSIGALIKVSSSRTMQEFETSMADAAKMFEDVKAVRDGLEKIAGKTDNKTYNDLRMVADTITQTTKMRIEAEEKSLVANQDIVQRLKAASRKAADLDSKIKALQLNRIGTFGTFISEAKDVESIKNSSLLTQSSIATNVLIYNAQFLSDASAVEKAVLKMFTVKSAEELSALEGEVKKGFDGAEATVKSIENQLKKLKEDEAITILAEAKTALLSTKQPIGNVAAGIRQNIKMKDKAIELATSMDRIIKEQTDKGKQEVALAYGEQEKAVGTVNQVISMNALFGILAGSVVLALSVFFGLIVYRSITKPLMVLVEVSDAISKGDLTHTSDHESKDEFGKVQNHIAGMIANLKEIVGKIKSSTTKLSENSTGLARTADELGGGSTTQGEQIDQSVTAITEMSQTTLEMAKNTSGTADMAQKMKKMALEGKAAMESTVGGLERLGNTVIESANKISMLGKKSEEINGIVVLIKDIADQTNLLALNAAIEAARAGELGRGFAVVADEVRQLAERTTTATNEIHATITSMQSGVAESIRSMEGGNDLMEKAQHEVNSTAHAIDEIVAYVEQVADMTQRVAVATEEQSSVSDSISGRMLEIATVTKQLGGSVSDIKKSSQELTSIASDLNETAGWFKV